MNLEIRKKSSTTWQHVKGNQSVILSNGTFRIINEYFELTELNGVDQFDESQTPITDIKLYDETGDASQETFASGILLTDRLKALGYPFFKRALGSGAEALNDLTDVNLSSVSNNQILRNVNGVWKNSNEGSVSAGVNTVTGDGVGGTASDPVLSFPDADQVDDSATTNKFITQSEKDKLASIDANHYLAPLQTTTQLSALTEASLTDKARVYVEDEESDYFYDATAVSGDIAPDDQTSSTGFWRKVAVGGETAASIKTKYESNPDTNAFTDAYKAKADISLTTASNLQEEKIISTVVDPSFTSAYTFNTALGRTFILPLTEACVLTPSTLAASTAITYTAIVSGDETLDVSAFTVVPSSDDYDGTIQNRLIIESYKPSSGSQVDLLTIENLS